MPLAAGTRLGNYEIVSPLGAGGMGEVYRAKDTKLDREVAIKVLPAAFAQHPERLARFEREAKVLATLKHNNIATIYAVEESSDGKALVMELVEGATLKGPVPVEAALKYAAQIASALDAAHEKGITHRDLKPANIMLTPEGTIKVLDFGLAAVTQPSQSDSEAGSNMVTLTMSPTNAGMIMGTAAYMSPEQASSQTVDRRADIWAFGVVLWEILTGKQLFHGTTISHILASVLKDEPDYSQVPPKVRRLLRRCLEKDPRRRLRDIGDAMELVEVDSEAAPAANTARSLTWFSRLTGIVVAVLAVAVAALAFVHFREAPPLQPISRLQILPPGTAQPLSFALSPDGRALAFIASSGGPNQMWIRSLDTLEARALAGTDGAAYPFWSPEGSYLGFFANGKLKKISASGGPAQTICDTADSRGGSWNRDGVIIFSAGPRSPILSVPATGGTPSAVTRTQEVGHRFPAYLPDGRHFFFNEGRVMMGSLDGATAVPVLPDNTNAQYVPPTTAGNAGQLVFLRDTTLMAQPFDIGSPHLAGDPVPVAAQVAAGRYFGSGAFSVSNNGVLVYASDAIRSDRELVWMDRNGRRLGAVGKPAPYRAFSLSPDEKTVAATVRSATQADIWMHDVARSVATRFTFQSGLNGNPIWSPDGTRMSYSHVPPGFGDNPNIYQKSAGGNGAEQLLLRGAVNAVPQDWAPDGRWIVYSESGARTATDLWLLPLEGERKPVPYLQTPFNETQARFSPDGKWMAYASDESGQYEVYVQAIPASGAKYQLSAMGGRGPDWRRDGREIYYVSGDQNLIAVPVKLGSTVELGAPQKLFQLEGVDAGAIFSINRYVPSRDGQRFLVNVPAGGEGASAPPLTVVLNWQAGLKK